MIKEAFFSFIQNLQEEITQSLSSIENKDSFLEDNWKRKEGGGGRTRVMEGGEVFERAGVNISGVHGELPDSLSQMLKVEKSTFYACGLSLVLHPVNPFVPTVHANWRYFELYDEEGNIADQWFGGGLDLTPYYLIDEDVTHFHSVCKSICDAHDATYYTTFKAKCDRYFWNTHREEARGVGGLFFDYLKKDPHKSIEDYFRFTTDVAKGFLEAYLPIVVKRKDKNYSEAQKKWQLIRRGRYVEFNLIHDKGTLFGLKTKGRIESIFMSLPPAVEWHYNHTPEAGSEEEKLINVLRYPKEWSKN